MASGIPCMFFLFSFCCFFFHFLLWSVSNSQVGWLLAATFHTPHPLVGTPPSPHALTPFSINYTRQAFCLNCAWKMNYTLMARVSEQMLGGEERRREGRGGVDDRAKKEEPSWSKRLYLSLTPLSCTCHNTPMYITSTPTSCPKGSIPCQASKK